MNHIASLGYRHNLCVTFIITMVFILCNGAVALGKDVYKPIKVIQKTISRREGTERTITDLSYNDNGNLVRFVSYYEGQEDDPHDDISLEWFDNQVVVSGFADWSHNLTGTIDLNEQGLASHIHIIDDNDGDLNVETDIIYKDNKILRYNISQNYSVKFEYDNNGLGIAQYYYGGYDGDIIKFKYDNSIYACNIPFPAIWHNCFYAHRYIAYADLLGQPLDRIPCKYNRHNEGWVDIVGNGGGILYFLRSNAGFTHASFDYEEFTYEYALMNSVDKKLTDKISVNIDGMSIVILGKDRDQQVQIFNFAGQLLKSTKEDRIDIDQRGIYLLRIGNSYQKIILKLPNCRCDSQKLLRVYQFEFYSNSFFHLFG